MNLLLILFLLFITTVSGNPAYSADYEKGVDASLRGDFKTAMKEWRPLAERGGATSQFQVGWLYYEGNGVTQNYKTAAKWYRLAAEQGYAYAQRALGRIYADGNGILKDNIHAYMWLSIAASLWDSDAGKIRDNVTKKMTPADISAAKKLIRECVYKKYKGC